MSRLNKGIDFTDDTPFNVFLYMTLKTNLKIIRMFHCSLLVKSITFLRIGNGHFRRDEHFLLSGSYLLRSLIPILSPIKMSSVPLRKHML